MFTLGNLIVDSLPTKLKQVYLDWKREPRIDSESLNDLKEKIQNSGFVDNWTKKE